MGSPQRVVQFPSRDWKPEAREAVSNPHPLPALALIVSIFACWVFWTVGYLSGRTAERGSQLGQVLALQPRADSLDRLVADSRAMLGRLARIQNPPRRHQNRTERPLGAIQTPAAPNLPAIPLLKIP